MNIVDFNELGVSSVKSIDDLLLFGNQLNAVYNSRSSTRTYLYLCKYGKGSSITIAQTMRIGRMSAYNALNKLKALGLIELDSRVQVLSTGGRRTEIWRLKR